MFEELITKNFPDIMKYINLPVQEAQLSLNMIIKNKPHLNVLRNCRTSKTRGSIRKKQRENHYQYRNNNYVSKFVNSKKKSQKALEKYLQVLRGNNLSSEILEPAKLLIKGEEIYRCFDENSIDITTNTFF